MQSAPSPVRLFFNRDLVKKSSTAGTAPLSFWLFNVGDFDLTDVQITTRWTSEPAPSAVACSASRKAPLEAGKALPLTVALQVDRFGAFGLEVVVEVTASATRKPLAWVTHGELLMTFNEQRDGHTTIEFKGDAVLGDTVLPRATNIEFGRVAMLDNVSFDATKQPLAEAASEMPSSESLEELRLVAHLAQRPARQVDLGTDWRLAATESSESSALNVCFTDRGNHRVRQLPVDARFCFAVTLGESGWLTVFTRDELGQYYWLAPCGPALLQALAPGRYLAGAKADALHWGVLDEYGHVHRGPQGLIALLTPLPLVETQQRCCGNVDAATVANCVDRARQMPGGKIAVAEVTIVKGQ